MKELAWVVEPSEVIIIIPDDSVRAYGNTVYAKGIQSGQVLMFAHLHTISVSVGQTLNSGETVGEMGSTGYSPSGAHLHVSLFDKGETVYYAKNTIDPKEYFIKYGYPCRTILTNPYGSPHYNDTKDSTLKKHEGNDFSSYRLIQDYA